MYYYLKYVLMIFSI